MSGVSIDRMIENIVNQFNELMSNRMIAIPVMLSAAIGGVVSIAAGYYLTFQLITLLSNH